MIRSHATIASMALIVDDDPGSVGMVSEALEVSGTTVIVARDGQRALELLERVDPDVILLDAMMPVMDGFETCRRMKSAPVMTDAPIIFMTGLTGSDDVRRGLQAGGVDYVTKPVKVNELIARVTTHILNARQMRDLRNAFDTQNRALVAMDVAGRIAWGSPGALQLMAEAGILMPDGTASAGMTTWLPTLPDQAVTRAPALNLGAVVLHYAGRTGGGDLLIRIETGQRGAPEALLAESFGLTGRESEVLLWLSQGKANRDIAEILTLSARTVNKHLEQIYDKLGVDNRTSAALLADRLLASRG
ncbi:DNA-binding response regulator [Paracoccus sp. 1_MG-2023]|uniref:response regulator transcription factor n=1 Tax=unclassified Paracoccus (in: a-proteobacteria) TaxID=2688777 RepID=UPI001C08F307|nr:MULTISPECIES: DNA-binding response regulator [unclassified Paracoccus (in: a-proteobacteria)]MBU2957652.1 response regulator [Paracoccus sp. C2R09]MDO6667500.1 DNA-binding response regulator [Paracoccus sp. 1_MG-2023]